MAQHLLINSKYVGENENETKAIRKLIKDIRDDVRELRETDDLTAFEAVYLDLPRDYNEAGDTHVSVKNVDVPETMVYGGRATLEIHWRGPYIRKVYLVA
jgi:hypothetical protein